MIKSIPFQYIVIVWLLSLSTTLPAQENVKHFNQGEPVLVRKKEFKDYSLKVPEYVVVSVKNEQLILKFVSIPDFAAILVVKFYDKKAETDLKELFGRTIDKNGKHTNWSKERMYAFRPEELRKGNAVAGYMVNGHSMDKLPMKIYNLLGVVESVDKKKMLIYSGSVSVNPKHKNYNDFEEIKRFMYDFRTIMISTEFTK